MFAMHLSRNDRSRTYMSTGPDNKRMPDGSLLPTCGERTPFWGAFHSMN